MSLLAASEKNKVNSFLNDDFQLAASYFSHDLENINKMLTNGKCSTEVVKHYEQTFVEKAEYLPCCGSEVSICLLRK